MSIPLDEHQNVALEAAYRMLDVVKRVEKQSLTLRVGIASGPLIGVWYSLIISMQLLT